MEEKIKIGEVYRHFKGEEKLYRVRGIARDCEDADKLVVIYEMLYETDDFPKGTIWVRGMDDFCGYKIFENGRKIKRFSLVE